MIIKRHEGDYHTIDRWGPPNNRKEPEKEAIRKRNPNEELKVFSNNNNDNDNNNNSQPKKRTCRTVNFVLPADHRIKLMESESDSDFNSNWRARYSYEMIVTGTGGLGNKRTS